MLCTSVGRYTIQFVFFYSLNISENEKENIEEALVKELRNNGVLRSDDYVGPEGSSRLF